MALGKMNGEQTQEEAIFERAVACASDSQRATFLDEACRDNTELRTRLELLLEGYFKADGFLAEEPRPGRGSADEAVGQTIGRYKLLENLGEGGCGAVYVAEQTEPVRRHVALKVIKLGMDTKAVVARFEAERQALALMAHPNIARVFDGGSTESGRPYFVMELVRGTKITDYCDQNNLPTKERLKLFIQVCHTIQHAHQKGIIHRDIKPSNILVTLQDGAPVPKVIDFGIAKATQGRLTDATVYTQLHQLIGTPAYMSPEQAEMTSADVDTRSDIYSLGVLLYELLTGQTPFDAKELLSAGVDAMRRKIRETEPLRPSTRLTALKPKELTTTAKRRSTEAPKLISLLKGDLDWVVMKCLEKDPIRRYETANGLAMDVDHYLADEPVVARPPSRLYRLRKSVRRNKLAYAAAAAIGAVLVAGVVVSTWQAVRATRAQRLALDEARFFALNAVEMYARHPEWPANERLEAIGRFSGALKLHKDWAELDRLLRQQLQIVNGRAASSDDPDSTAVMMELTGSLLAQGKFAQAEAVARKGLAIREKMMPDDWRAFNARTLLGQALLGRKRYAEAESLLVAGCEGIENRADTLPDIGIVRLRDALGSLVKLCEETKRPDQAAQWRKRLADLPESPLWPSFSPDSRALAVPRGGMVTLIDPATSREMERIPALGTNVKVAAYSPDGKFLVSGARDGTIRVLSCAERRLLREINQPQADVRLFQFRADGARLFCVNLVNGVYQGTWWDARTWRQACRPFSLEGTTMAAISPDGRLLAAGALCWLRWLNAETGEVLATAVAHEAIIVGMAFSRDGSRVASTSEDGMVALWDASSFKLITKFKGHTRACGAAFSPDARLLATGGGTAGEAVKLWELPSCHELMTFSGDGSRFFSVAFSPDGKWLAARALPRNQLHVWPVPSTAEVETLERAWPAALPLQTQARICAESGDVHGRKGHLNQAIRYYRKAIEVDPTNQFSYLKLAAALAFTGDAEGHGRLCRQAVDQFGSSRDPLVCENAAKACLMLPSSGADFAAISNWAHIAVTVAGPGWLRPWAEFLYGHVEYRMGHFAEAVSWEQKVASEIDPTPVRDVQTQCILAMAQHQLTNTAEARAALTKADRIARTKLPLLDSGDLGQSWWDFLLAQMLLREAQALIGPEVPPQPASAE